jgi:hypothetical protein
MPHLEVPVEGSWVPVLIALAFFKYLGLTGLQIEYGEKECHPGN